MFLVSALDLSISSITTIVRTIVDARAAAMALCLVAAAMSTSAQAALPAPVAAALERLRLAPDSISIHVADGDGRVLLSHLSDVPRNPASVMKLVTTYAALDRLGPGFTWHTRFFADRPPAGGVLDGNLYIVGGGDPMILVEDFLGMLFALRQRGIERIRGDLVLDAGYFDESSIDTAPIDEQASRAYNAWPASLVVNFRATRFVMVPAGPKIDVIAEPPSTTLGIDNRLEAVDGPCQGAHRRLVFDPRPHPGGTTVRLSGRYPRTCGESSITRTVLSPEHYLRGVFEALWSALGGVIEGGLVHGAVPDGAVLLLDRESRPLAEVIAATNKFSNNLMARSLLLTLGAETLGGPGTVAAGRQAIGDWLAANAFELPHLELDNGAGLSRGARITARGLADMLVDALHHPFRDEYLSSLSLIGIDGSTRKRRARDVDAGQFRLKTGLLDGVRAAAGYGLTARGTRLVIVVIQNDPALTYDTGNAVQDAVLSFLYRNY